MHSPLILIAPKLPPERRNGRRERTPPVERPPARRILLGIFAGLARKRAATAATG
jgi:hypothetical protein